MRLSRINTLLLIIIITINGYTLMLPFVPQLTFWWQQHHSNTKTALMRIVQSPPRNSLTPISQANRLVIPSMLLDQPFYEGPDSQTLNKGLWLRPRGATPDTGGNTIIVGHRFTYTNPRGTLYFLNKIRPDDAIALFWHGRKYTYQVDTIREVPASTVAIEAPTVTPQLTLYTCTPLWNPVKRLVVTARLTGVAS